MSNQATYVFSYQDAAEVLRMVRESEGLATLDIEFPGLRISVTRTAAGDVAAAPASAPTPASVSASAAPAVVSAAAPPAAAGSAAQPVEAPMLGIFYRSPSPGAPPFVDVGSVVAAGDTVGLIEVMKLFSPVTAPCAGRVVRIGAGDGALVEHAEALMHIEPAPAA